LAGIRQAMATPRRVSKGVFVLADPVFERDDPRVGLAKGATSRASLAEESQGDLRGGFPGLSASAGGRGLPRLPATFEEAKVIVGVVPLGQGTMVTGFDASRATAMSDDLRQYQIVHFATHGVINNQHPELSGIVLSLIDKNGNQENGFLQLHDIYNLRLSAELVTLSACQTGLGKEVSGEGMVGLTRGFMYSGAKSMLVSLWKVDDRATSELMRRFYHALLVEGKPPAAALRAAKIAMLEENRWKAPFYWAAFVFQGDPARIVILPPTPWYKRPMASLLIFVGLIPLVGVYALRRLKKRFG
jgi:CHAT domain-containing protein